MSASAKQQILADLISVRGGSKVAAVKLYRQMTGEGLKEGVRAVESMWLSPTTEQTEHSLMSKPDCWKTPDELEQGASHAVQNVGFEDDLSTVIVSLFPQLCARIDERNHQLERIADTAEILVQHLRGGDEES